MKREVEQPFVANESYEDSRVDFDLPLIFDDYSEEKSVEEKKAYLVEEQGEHQEGVEEEADGGSRANDVPLSKANLPASMCELSELHKPLEEPEHFHLFLTSSKPLSKATYLDLTPFKEWLFNDPRQPECPLSNYSITISQTHQIWTKKALFPWLVIFQPDLMA